MFHFRYRACSIEIENFHKGKKLIFLKKFNEYEELHCFFGQKNIVLYVSSLCEDVALIKVKLLAVNRASQVAQWETVLMPFKVLSFTQKDLISFTVRLLDFQYKYLSISSTEFGFLGGRIQYLNILQYEIFHTPKSRNPIHSFYRNNYLARGQIHQLSPILV